MLHAGFLSPALLPIALAECALAVFAALIGRAGFWPGLGRVALVCLVTLPAVVALQVLYGWIAGTEDAAGVAANGRWIGVLGAGVMALVTVPIWASVGAVSLWLRVLARRRVERAG